jgi:hypothetical protein
MYVALRRARCARGPRGTRGRGEACAALRYLLARCARTLLLAHAHAPPPPVRAALLAEAERRAEAVGWRQGCSTVGARTQTWARAGSTVLTLSRVCKALVVHIQVIA